MDFGPIHRVAEGQRALVTHQQLRELGISSGQIERLASQHYLLRTHRTVYRLAGSPPSWEQDLLAAVLAHGPTALLSHRTGLAWWGIERCGTDLVEVVTEESSRVRLAGVRAHQTRDLPSADRRRHNGIPVTSVERCLIDAGRYLPAGSIGAALDHSVRDGLTTYERFQRRVEELGRRGRDGISTARLVLADRGYGDGFGFEKAMRGLVRDAGLPAPQREFKVHVDGHRYRVDFAYADSMLGIECDSSRWHELPYQRELDLVRQNRIQNEGLLLLRYTVARLRDDRAGVQAEIVDAVARRAGLRPASHRCFPDVEPR